MKWSVFFILLLTSITTMSQQYHLLIGTYTKGKSEGIYVYDFDARTGTNKPLSVTKDITNPSYLAVSPDGRYVYAASEEGDGKGALHAYAFDRQSGRLNFINKVASGGDHPCYVSVDATGKWVAVANYSGGNLRIYAVGKDGSLGPAFQQEDHKGKSINTERQEKAHVHSVFFSKNNKHLFVCDLGIDQVKVYGFDPAKEHPLTLDEAATLKAPAGSGPRHLAFHPSLPVLYVIEELSGTVNVYEKGSSGYRSIQQISSHPAGYQGTIGSADIHLSPDARFLYASNRGDANSIARFSVDAKSGRLNFLDVDSTGGKTPRNFAIDPTGSYLIAANQNSDNIVVFKRDNGTGALQKTDHAIEVGSPVCLVLVSKQ